MSRQADRVHTALHGFLKEECRKAGIEFKNDAAATALLKTLRQNHPRLQDLGARTADIERILNSSASINDALLPVRNRASLAHPNEDLLGDAEAMFVINVTRSLITYLAAKLTDPHDSEDAPPF